MSDLPEGWVLVKLGSIVQPSKEKVDPKRISNIPYVGLEHIEKDSGRLLGHGYSNEVKSTKAKFGVGDLLYGKLRPYLNKVLVPAIEGVCSTDILVFPKSQFVLSKFLLYRFLSLDFVRYAAENVNGVQHPRVSFQTLSHFPVALPPLPEQRRIVAKLEKLLGKVDMCKERLDKIPTILKRFRQSVLSAACSGRLTEDWRERNTDVESAGEMLKEVKRIEDSNTQDSELPIKWLTTTVGNLAADIGYGFTASASYSQVGPKFLRITDIQNGTVNWDNVPYCEISQLKLSKYLLESGDIVFARTGATTGKSFLVQSCPEAIFASYLIRVKPKQIVLSAFLYLFFQSNSYWEQISENISGSAQPNCNASKLSSLRVSLPPLPEQQEIVRRVEGLFKVADRIEERYKKAKGYVDKITQAILAKAFRGELAVQDADDEPAAVLLERIREERGKRGGESQNGKMRKGRRKQLGLGI